MFNTLWFNNTTHFGMRGGKEHGDLCWGDIQLKEDISDGEAIRYLENTEGQTKTRTGENPRDIRPVTPRMYENENKERCPVQLHKAFAQRRPEDCNIILPCRKQCQGKKRDTSLVHKNSRWS